MFVRNIGSLQILLELGQMDCGLAKTGCQKDKLLIVFEIFDDLLDKIAIECLNSTILVTTKWSKINYKFVYARHMRMLLFL